MLILTRSKGEVIVIGDDITITVSDIKGTQVRLGINAPKEISVYRDEIYQRIKKEERDSSINRPSFDTSTKLKLLPLLSRDLGPAGSASSNHNTLVQIS